MATSQSAQRIKAKVAKGTAQVKRTAVKKGQALAKKGGRPLSHRLARFGSW